MGLFEVLIGIVTLLFIVGFTILVQPPNRWVERFSRDTQKDN